MVCRFDCDANLCEAIMKDSMDASAWADSLLAKRRTFCIQTVAPQVR
jgi:hypothetical protein